jgi:putative ABC transport system permease protein
MLRFLTQKLLHKKWMVVSLLIGNILLIAIAVSHPMYKRAALNRMLTDEFNVYMEQNSSYPGILSYTMTRNAGKESDFEQLNTGWQDAGEILGQELSENIRVLQQTPTKADNCADRPDLKDKTEVQVQLSTMTDLENHVQMVSGDLYGDNTDGVLDAVVSEAAFVNFNLLIGDEVELRKVYMPDGTRVRVRISGVFTYADATDPYWVEAPDSYSAALFINETAFEQIYLGEINTSANILAHWYTLVDEDQLRIDDVDSLMMSTEQYISTVQAAGGRISTPVYMNVLESYKTKKIRLETTLVILQVPIIVLLLSFLFMISGQMLSMEQNEISILKSRGAGRGQIFLLYLLQTLLLDAVSFAVALPVGMLLCQMLGSSSAFLEFVRRRVLTVYVDGEVLLYGLGGMLLSVLVTVLPVIRYSRISIVNLKQERSRSKKKLWQKLYLDVVLLLVSLYGLYTFNGQKEEMALKIMNGGTLDPLLYFSASLFILGAGLVFLRIWPYLVKLIFRLGKRIWKPESYASFLQIIRTGNKQLFIMEFLILTVALGIFNATIARTILSNDEENVTYQLGADVVMQEKWKDNSSDVAMGLAEKLTYQEPDSNRFMEIEGVERVAKVIHVDADVTPASQSKTSITATVYGITTNEFGLVVSDMGENPYSLVQYLNVLGSNPNAVLVSSNFKSRYGYKLGDTITYNYNKTNTTGVIYGFFDYFPTYVSTSTVFLDDGTAEKQENYMIVANMSYLLNVWGVTPYELWFTMKDGSPDPLADYIETNNVEMVRFDDIQEELYEVRNEPMLQGTNGILTMSFIVILVLCCAGFLIYWILSIRERELLFGVFRAMGMSRNGIIRMLFLEQLFSSVICIGVGAGVGVLASKLFVPLIQIAYASENQALPLKLVTQSSDMARLFVVIALMFVVCMAVLIRIIFHMKITNALKLGED